MGVTGRIAFKESGERLHVKWIIKYNWDLFPHLFLKSPYFSLCNFIWYLDLEQISNALFMRLCKIDSAAARDLRVTANIQTTGVPVSYAMGVKERNSYKVATCDYIFPTKNETFYEGDWFALGERFNFRKSSEYMDSEGSVTVFCRFVLEPYSRAKNSSKIPLNGCASSSERCDDLYLSKGTMTLSEDFKDVCFNKSTMTVHKDLCLDKGIANLSENFKELYFNQSFTDVTIKVKSKEFHAHKIVLVARSTVFASMFKYDTAERISGLVEITDCDADSFEDFLLFLYSGKLNIVSEGNAVNLYETADKYDIKELKEECVRRMIEDMTVSGFCDVVRLAIMHNESELLSAATKFFVNNLGSILTTTNWQTFLEENPIMGNELFLKTVKIQDNEK